MHPRFLNHVLIKSVCLNLKVHLSLKATYGKFVGYDKSRYCSQPEVSPWRAVQRISLHGSCSDLEIFMHSDS